MIAATAIMVLLALLLAYFFWDAADGWFGWVTTVLITVLFWLLVIYGITEAWQWFQDHTIIINK